jgi:hypothetical protein
MAFPGTYNFNYYRGDSLQFVVRPKTSSGAAFDLTDFIGGGSFVIANRRGSLGVQTEATATIDDTTNIVTCTITPTVGRTLTSGTYVYDVEISNDEEYGNALIYTLLTGTITVTDDITGAVI